MRIYLVLFRFFAAEAVIKERGSSRNWLAGMARTSDNQVRLDIAQQRGEREAPRGLVGHCFYPVELRSGELQNYVAEISALSSGTTCPS